MSNEHDNQDEYMRAEDCMCPECWKGTDPISEMCDNCAYFGCTEEVANCDS